MAELLLVNPRRRKRRKSSSRRRRRAAPRARVTRRRRRRAVAVAAPRRRRRRRSYARIARRRRRNPSIRGGISSLRSNLMPGIKAGFTGALGALGLDLLIGQLNARFPTLATNQWAKVGVKLGGALLVGLAGGYILKGKGRALTEGAMTVLIHDVLKDQLAQAMPTVPLGEYLTFAPTVGYDAATAPQLSTGMGEYLDVGSQDYSADLNGYG